MEYAYYCIQHKGGYNFVRSEPQNISVQYCLEILQPVRSPVEDEDAGSKRKYVENSDKRFDINDLVDPF